MASDIDRKLCLTAASISAVTRKDLAAAFRRANPQTSFDIERAHKWLQGHSRPRRGSSGRSRWVPGTIGAGEQPLMMSKF